MKEPTFYEETFNTLFIILKALNLQDVFGLDYYSSVPNSILKQICQFGKLVF